LYGHYECETWSVTLKKENRLKTFEKRALSRKSGPKREEMTGGWRNWNNGEFHCAFQKILIG
jgi:hypothetical protein